MLEMGLLVALGMIAMFVKLGWKWRILALSNPFALDVATFVLLSVMHWGTFSGMMVAAIGALACSVMITLGRYLYGYKVRGQYVPGVFDVGNKL